MIAHSRPRIAAADHRADREVAVRGVCPATAVAGVHANEVPMIANIH
jgi:hypothetical protein